MRKISKKGAELTIGTLVIIVLAIIVLVVVALGFGTGWSNLWQKVTSYFGGGANVDSIKQACSYACTTKATFDYCCAVRDVKYEKGGDTEKKLCTDLMTGADECTNFRCDGENANVCAAVKCAKDQVKLGTDCVAPETKDGGRTLYFDGKPIPVGSVCCKV